MLDQANGASEQGAFYIQATGPSSRPRHTLKQGNTFAVCDSHGDVGASPGGPDGLFNNDTRFLSRLELLINGTQPLLLGSRIRDDNISLSVDLTNADIYQAGQIALSRDTIHIVRTLYLWGDVAHQRIHVSNYGGAPVAFSISLTFDCDFLDLFEARGMKRERRGTVAPPTVEGPRVRVAYAGLDTTPRSTILAFEPTPDRLAAHEATYQLQLEGGGSTTLFLSTECHGLDQPQPETFFKGFMKANRAEKAATRDIVTVETSNDIFNEVMDRSSADLAMLITQTAQGPYPYAGTPWYSTTFGRDGIITAMQMLWIDPRVAKGVLQRLAHYQADAFDGPSDAEPGKVLHEMRGGEMAALREVPFGLYYGTIDATPLFIVLAGQYLQRTGDEDAIRQLWPAITRALLWMDESGDRDGDGFLEYFRATDAGLQNQGWKDSFDSVFHADGTLAEGPIALVEVQGYAYAAKRMAALCASRLGMHEQAIELDRQAAALADAFEQQFWCEEIGTYAVALDGRKQPCRVRTSNAGQVLWSGIARPGRARIVADGLVAPNFFSGFGIRTVPIGEPRYNPMSYHNGSIWPHDNSLIALGMARYGLLDHVERVFEGLFATATYMDLRRLPELFCGFRRRRGAAPTLYPVACSPQAWAAGTPFMLLQAMLGLEFDPVTRSIHFNNPKLPSSLDELTICNLGFAEAQVDVTLRRVGEHVALRVIRSVGSIQVSMNLS
ncbi:amylo-alpha-1,6-glucosidase [Lichenihabitans sp. Uapishka_5]|uniref:amylo-alpha-1,6-glucosidase n=1 Tax=Lichenihabitans sp. Uapishka_5 TaxID=3037302 RepID=UPI0029E81C18|nr:amylo-alpha-1,6-glucosidase [Lichenihabitans sp. Uapishka_5]MDX7950662.1 amylo-alpha-1,6-glucosidase [Lichenihabitans sp. Uapishka_5]